MPPNANRGVGRRLRRYPLAAIIILGNILTLALVAAANDAETWTWYGGMIAAGAVGSLVLLFGFSVPACALAQRAGPSRMRRALAAGFAALGHLVIHAALIVWGIAAFGFAFPAAAFHLEAFNDRLLILPAMIAFAVGSAPWYAAVRLSGNPHAEVSTKPALATFGLAVLSLVVMRESFLLGIWLACAAVFAILGVAAAVREIAGYFRPSLKSCGQTVTPPPAALP